MSVSSLSEDCLWLLGSDLAVSMSTRLAGWGQALSGEKDPLLVHFPCLRGAHT